MPVSSKFESSGRKSGDYVPGLVNLDGYGDCFGAIAKHAKDNDAESLQNLMDRDICGRRPSSAARMGPFIFGRSGWQFAMLWLVAQAFGLVNCWLRAALFPVGMQLRWQI